MRRIFIYVFALLSLYEYFYLQDAIALAYEVGVLVQQMAGGVGPQLVKPDIID